jgi:hydrogenase maturation protein HypF
MAVAGRATELIRSRVRVTGTVQGVGFRPYVYRLAHELELSGFVLNDSNGVLVEVQGERPAVEAFAHRLGAEAPPLAAVERVSAQRVALTGEPGFRIIESVREGPANVAVSPDTATCEDCVAELRDPADRRYRYPFINCTNCGPRFTIVRGVPYDRPLTTMAGFAMCSECRAEYEDPRDRRFHAQPNACPECGPQLALLDRDGGVIAERDEALRRAARALTAGAIVAVKGIGGFHLACLAGDEQAVAALRARKHREDKPFALMARDLTAALVLVSLTAREESLLTGSQRPIVVAPRSHGARVAGAVAPDSSDLGVMLPYSPLHHLLIDDVGETLVMTSANVSDEPIAYRDEDALGRLRSIADLFLLHDRPIETRTDDSVLRAAGGSRKAVMLRRSRGYVPAELRLPTAAAVPVLACGAELKSTFCLARGERAWVSHHIGDLANYETLASFEQGIAHFERLFEVRPAVVAHDLHPEYLSTKHALARDELEPIAVQHHHAHLAACLAEHGEHGPAVGAIYDGTGYGTDGTIWGGELLVGDLGDFERVGHLLPVRLPGGARAVREPWRMACAWFLAAVGEVAPAPEAIARAVGCDAWGNVRRLAVTGLASPITTSIGRLFDAVAALCGLRLEVTYEGQAAAALEAACDPGERGSYPLPLDDGSALIIDPRPAIRAALDDLRASRAIGTIAARFHNGLAGCTVAACLRLAQERGVDQVVLSGGSFQNRRLLSQTAEGLEAAGLRVLIPTRLPPNDGGISFGQAAVAAARLAQDGPV